MLVAACWAAAAGGLGRPRDDVIAPLLAGALAAAAAVLAMLLIRPWRTRPMTAWPFVFLAGTVIHLLGTLAGGMLLYFASHFGSVGTWLCLVGSYWAALFGLVRVYGSCMKQSAPPGTNTPEPRDPASTGHSE